MLPVLFRLGPLTLHTYGMLVALGFAAALFYCLRRAEREGIDGDAFMNLFFIIVAAAIAGSRLLYVLFNLPFFLEHPLKAFAIWEGGLVFHGGLLLAVPCAYLYLRRAGLPVWKTADIAAPGIALGQAIGRLGCLSAGCCFGRVSDLPWGITFSHPETLAPRDLPLHPTQLYDSLSNVVIFLVLHFYSRRPVPAGTTFWLYLVLAPSARFVIEHFRAEGSRLSFLPGLSAIQGLALVIAPAALVMFVLFSRRRSGEH
jgi:phosphatidylglycerol:prolipoprotein diacylglycerol transferase